MSNNLIQYCALCRSIPSKFCIKTCSKIFNKLLLNCLNSVTWPVHEVLCTCKLGCFWTVYVCTWHVHVYSIQCTFIYFSLFHIIVTGFCDYNLTVHSEFGNYTWEETIGGSLIILPCANEGSTVNSSVMRRCLVNDDGWGDIDFTACRNSKPLLPM